MHTIHAAENVILVLDTNIPASLEWSVCIKLSAIQETYVPLDQSVSGDFMLPRLCSIMFSASTDQREQGFN